MADAESARPPPGGEASKPRDAVKADREAAKEAKRVAKAAAAAAAAAKKAGVAPKAGQGAGPKEAAGPSQPAAKKQTTQGAAASTKRGAATGERSGPASVAAASSSNPDAAEGSRMQSQSSRTKIPVEPATTSTTTVLGGVSLFGNVSTSTHAKEISMQVVAASYRSQVHPSVLQLAQHLSNFTVVGADARAIAVLKVLRDFVVDYRISSGAVFSRDLVTKLGPQIGFLVNARPLGASVGHAIRYLKYEISVTPVELNEAEAKERILSRIDHFVRDRITYATRVIAHNLATGKIKDGDVVLTFARSSVVQQTLLEAWERGKRFSVIIVDARPLCEGRKLLSTLVAREIPCSYGLLTSLSSLISQASLVLLGTASLLANGALYSRAGTAPCAMMAKAKGVPVIVCCETYKFSERVQLDGFVINEAGNPIDILNKEPVEEGTLSKLITRTEWKESSSLGAVNLLYDLTPPRYITAVASEVGLSGPESVGVILRDYKSVLYGQ